MLNLTGTIDVHPCSAAPTTPQLQNLNLLNDPRVFSSFPAYFGGRADSGVDVTHVSALGAPAVQQAVKILGGAMAQLEVDLMRRVVTPSGKTRIEPVRNHNGHLVAKNRSVERETSSGSTMSIRTFRSTMMNHATIAGDGFAAIQRTNGGKPLQTVLLPPYPQTRVEFNDLGKLKICTNIITPRTGQMGKTFFLDPIDVFQVMNLSHDGMSGYPLTEIAADALGLGLATYKYGGKSFANGTKLSGALQDPGMPDQDQIEGNLARWYASNAGLDNVSKIAYLTGGTTFAPMAMTNIDAQLVDMLNQNPRIVAQLFNIPPFLLGVTDSSGLKMAELITFFIRFTLGDWICNWAEEMRLKFLTEDEWKRGDLFFKFDVSKFLATTFQDYVKTIVEGVGGPIMTRDEGRVMVQMNPATEDDEFLERSTGAPATTDNETTSDPGTRLEQVENTIANLLRNGVMGLSRVESQKVAGASQKPDFSQWIDEFYGKEWPERLSSLVGSGVAVEYCRTRQAELKGMLERSGRGACEKDANNHQARGLKLVEMQMQSNGHAN